MQGKLFTQAFLEQGIKQTEAWQTQQQYAQFCETLKQILAHFSADSTINEATTESEIIRKVLSALDWHDTLPQQIASAKGRYDVPDGLLFPDSQAKTAALAEKKLVQHDPQAPQPLTSDYLETVRRAALTLLYRLLFLFYAEDRNLLPIYEIRYAYYALRKIRHEIALFIDKGDGFSATAQCHYIDLQALFHAIATGDTAIGLPPYSGGLFDKQPLLERTRLPDAPFAILIDKLSRRTENGKRQWINYRDLTVVSTGQVTSDKPKEKKEVEAINDLLAQTRAIAKRERFLHWEVAFPTVWRHLERSQSVGGFDVVMSNPPWERVKLQ
jgi:hypothetical protein